MTMQTELPADDNMPAGWTAPEEGFEGIDDPFAGYDEAFGNAEVKETPEFTDLPDGKYQAFVFSAKPYQIEKPGSKKFGYHGIALRFRVLNGPHRGQMQSHMRSFHKDDMDSMGWLKKDLAALGVLDAMQQQGIGVRQLLQGHLPLFLDRTVEIQVKRTASQDPANPFVNVYINRVLNGVVIPDDLRIAPTSGSNSGNGNGNMGAGNGKSAGAGGGIAW